MARAEIVEIVMPDGTVINAEVSVSDSITDVGAQRRLGLGEAKESSACRSGQAASVPGSVKASRWSPKSAMISRRPPRAST
jgi:hypothetical protein